MFAFDQRSQRMLPDTLLLVYAIFVVGLGAYTRLTDSGLGCPDWPKCYGHWLVAPDITSPWLSSSMTQKAWIEMIHRYAAGFLGLFAMMNTIRHWTKGRLPTAYVLGLACLLFSQACFGMITVTWKLHPLAVMPHLMGGMMTACTLACIRWKVQANQSRHALTIGDFWFLRLFVACLWLQVILGGWTSANYAALICPDFPTCQGQWIPGAYQISQWMHWLPIGPNYETGGYSATVRLSIHMSHRLGALMILLGAVVLACRSFMFTHPKQSFHRAVARLLGLIGMQTLLGIGNVVFQLPLWMAVGHNLTALFVLLQATGLLIQTEKQPAKSKTFSELYHVSTV